MKLDADRFIQDSFTNGTVFDGKYRIDGLIGTGNFSHVFKARHESMGRDVALKILKPEMKKMDPGLSVRFMNEVKVVSKLHHPNSVTIFDFGETEGIQYMVLEYIPGTDLDEVLKEKKRFSAKIAIDLVLQILSALEEAHHHNIIHRDLKPSNVMLSKVKGTDGKKRKPLVKVLDFGVAKVVGQQAGDGRRSTKFIGTPVYMSPEQVLGQNVSAASDLYSVGLILYELLTGDVPVTAKNLAGVAQIHIDEAPIPFRKIAQLPKALQSVILTATQRFPEDRFPNAVEFADALRGVQDGKKATRSEDVSASTRAFFLEREDTEDDMPMLSLRREDKPTTATKRVKRPKEKPNGLRPTPSDEKGLELDMKKVRALERSKTQRQAAIVKPIDQGRTGSEWALVGFGAVALFLTAGLIGTLIPTESVPLRFLLALSPIVIGGLATSFSPMARKGSESIAERWIEPILQRSIPLFFFVLIVAMLLFPEHAALACRDHAAWFLPEALKAGALGNALSSLGSLFASLFSLAAKILPW